MKTYALSDGHKIVNAVVGKNKEEVEQASGLTAIETTGEPWIDWTLEEEGWRSPKPYPSWIWSGDNWSAPIPVPEDGDYRWDEDSTSWVKREQI